LQYIMRVRLPPTASNNKIKDNKMKVDNTKNKQVENHRRNK